MRGCMEQRAHSVLLPTATLDLFGVISFFLYKYFSLLFN
jgi:hypothetical protein